MTMTTIDNQQLQTSIKFMIDAVILKVNSPFYYELNSRGKNLHKYIESEFEFEIISLITTIDETVETYTCLEEDV